MNARLMELARRFLAALVVLAVAPQEASAADDYPTRQIRIIVPTAPGGGSDISARLIKAEIVKWAKVAKAAGIEPE